MWRALSPLAEGRELKYCKMISSRVSVESPLAEGRELKYGRGVCDGKGMCVAPRGGA